MLMREKIKLSDLHRGIKDMKHLPSALFIVDGIYEKNAIAEANVLGIPTFGMVDTNTNPNIVDYPIPSNDDSVKSIKIITEFISNSITESIGKYDDNVIDKKVNADLIDVNDNQKE